MSNLDQKAYFKQSEGDSFYRRNIQSIENLKNNVHKDPLVKAIEYLEIKPRDLLEIGCGTGYRLAEINRKFNTNCYGIDPSIQSIKNGSQEFPSITLTTGTADLLPFEDLKFDMLIFGFCLYLCDRNDLFKIGMEANRVLPESVRKKQAKGQKKV
jgi:ubiquinone/menaquinone biosynthesis C-methylase UbiE